MMDQQCIDSIINVISKSNMADLDFLNTEIRPITCEIDEDGMEKQTVHKSLYDYMYSKVELSEAWVAGNLLLFTVFDGYLENKYHLTEGASFREHYNNLLDNTSIEIIEKTAIGYLKLLGMEFSII
ncbi:MAG: hypothetical protein ACLR1W_01950 [Agathobacter rectalis]|uniref:hypothetical protein n=1 Tax=Agathobacter rectalis TaxID=39491 RepID=UPI0027D2CFB4|nr:hypothetical protein [Agathobacter rectalis]MCB6951088.1 hypothetical protein [Agathobacter rectalis]